MFHKDACEAIGEKYLEANAPLRLMQGVPHEQVEEMRRTFISSIDRTVEAHTQVLKEMAVLQARNQELLELRKKLASASGKLDFESEPAADPNDGP